MLETAIDQGFVATAIENGIARITFYHPMSNSLPGKLLAQLATQINAAAADEDVRVIVLQSEGEKAFCAGASFDELISIKDFDTGKRFFSGFAHVINAMRHAPKFVICRVQGKAVGGGVGLASAADYALAHETASIKLSELAVGIGPFVVGPAVERKMGSSAFAALSINASEWQSAQWAKTNGLFIDTFPSLANLDDAIDRLADTLSNCNPEAMRELKGVLWQNTSHWDTLLLERAEISGRLVLSDFTVSAINKFKKKD